MQRVQPKPDTLSQIGREGGGAHAPAGTLAGDLEIVDLLDWPKPNYQKIWDLQKDLVEGIASGQRSEAIVFCEHERVLTAGRRSKGENVLDSRDGLAPFEIERGGDVTLHNPGQLVVYPLIHLRQRFPGGLHQYLRWLEHVTIRYLLSLGLEAGRFGPTGVWIKESKTGAIKKIASIGIAVRRWVTYHGLALNVDNDLEDFRRIRPCGFESEIMTSLKAQGLLIDSRLAAQGVRRVMQSVV